MHQRMFFYFQKCQGLITFVCYSWKQLYVKALHDEWNKNKFSVL